MFAGCHAPTWWCDAHHVLHWIDGGETSVENAALLCERHHTKVHHGFRIERQPDGRWHTYTDGTEILTGTPPEQLTASASRGPRQDGERPLLLPPLGLGVDVPRGEPPVGRTVGRTGRRSRAARRPRRPASSTVTP